MTCSLFRRALSPRKNALRAPHCLFVARPPISSSTEGYFVGWMSHGSVVHSPTQGRLGGFQRDLVKTESGRSLFSFSTPRLPVTDRDSRPGPSPGPPAALAPGSRPLCWWTRLRERSPPLGPRGRRSPGVDGSCRPLVGPPHSPARGKGLPPGGCPVFIWVEAKRGRWGYFRKK